MAPKLTKAQKEANLKANQEDRKRFENSDYFKKQEKIAKSKSSKDQMKRDLARIKKLGPAPKDPDFRSGFTKTGEETQKLGRKPKVAPENKPPRGSGNYMSQFDKDMNAAKKKGDVKEQTRLMNVKKSKEANIKAAKNKKINEGVKKVLKIKGPGGGNRRKGEPLEIQEKLLIRKDALKKNMGGAIMKNRGGMFKGTY